MKSNQQMIKALTALYLSDLELAETIPQHFQAELDRYNIKELGFTAEQVKANWDFYLGTSTGYVRAERIVNLYFSTKSYAWIKELYQRNRKDIRAMEAA
jgi:hypothetical protein